MKPLFTLFLLAFSFLVNAQNVYIPDSVFKHSLLNYDTNHDGEIQVTEAEAITDLQLGCKLYHYPSTEDHSGSQYFLSVTDFTGIGSFVNLRRLSIDYCTDPYPLSVLKNLDLSGVTGLRFLSCNGFYLEQVNLAGCTGLDSLWLYGENQGVRSFNTTLRSVDLSGCTSLKWLYCGGFTQLDTLVGLQECTSLKSFTFQIIGSAIINTTGLTQLETVYFEGGGRINLDVNNNTSLTSVTMYEGEVNAINVAGCSNLQNFSCMLNSLSPVDSIDFSSCPNLKTLYLNGESLLYLNIKNGSSLNPGGSNFGYVPNLAKVCADEFEVMPILNSIFASGNTTAFVSSYCSFTPGGAYNTLKGKLSLDENNNGCNITNRTLEGVPVLISNSANQRVVVNSGTGGNFSLFLNQGSFRVSPYTPYAYYTLNPLFSTAVFDTMNSLVSEHNFCLRPNGSFNDLEISFLPSWPPARPGFTAWYTLTYKNRGTTILSGDVKLNFDGNKINFVSASENTTTQLPGQLIWNYNNLQPFESKTISVRFALLPPPVNNIDDTLIYLASISPSVNDATQFDNSFILPQRITGSFDPNDKQCIEGSKLDISKIGDYLHYQIRFQNEGTDTAFNIIIADTLSDNLDWNTFEYIGSSHTADVKLTNNKLEFFFANINLPYKAIDEPGSNGWVAFKIKPKPSVVIGDSLNNRAAIYFDFNLPVITNTATTIVSSAATPVPVKLEYFSVNKKEHSNQLNWKASCTYGNAAFVIERSEDGIHFKSIRNMTATALRCQLPFTFVDNNPVAGKNYYRLKISDADGKSFYSKTLVVGNGKAGVEITAVVSNTVYLNCSKQQTVTMKVIAADGTVLANQQQQLAAGNSNFYLPVIKRAKGIYTLVVFTNNGEIITKRFVN
jgi:uncharacterized repeat protein (TIGR01451 family)